MILKGAQRGNAKKLAVHLLNDVTNDVVEVHEVSGFISDDVTGAFKEVQAVAKGTRCSQPFFSVSLNPPADAAVTIEMFENAADRIAEANGLAGQPRVIVFHEKEGRRHAHVVWSRINAKTMTAKNLPHFKNKLQALSRDLYFENQWKMPDGLRDRSLKSPTNVTLVEWQAAKRRGKNAIDQKALIQQCWAASDDRASFEATLKDHGYILAKGDRRGHVIVCHDGEVMAVARATGTKAKAVRERLGESENLPSVEQAMEIHAHDVRNQFIRIAGEARSDLTEQQAELEKQRKQIIVGHKSERAALDKGQASRWVKESTSRAARFKKGFAGIWQRISGQRKKTTKQNVAEVYAALPRDRAQRQRLIDAQLNERRTIDQKRAHLRQVAFGLIKDIRSDRDRLIAKLTVPQPTSARRRQVRKQQNNLHHTEPDFSP